MGICKIKIKLTVCVGSASDVSTGDLAARRGGKMGCFFDRYRLLLSVSIVGGLCLAVDALGFVSRGGP